MSNTVKTRVRVESVSSRSAGSGDAETRGDRKLEVAHRRRDVPRSLYVAFAPTPGKMIEATEDRDYSRVMAA